MYVRMMHSLDELVENAKITGLPLASFRNNGSKIFRPQF